MHHTSIQVAGLFEAIMLRDLSEATFLETFGSQNTPENMRLYLEEHLNLEKITEELANEHNTFFTAWYKGALAGYAKVRDTERLPEFMDKRALEIERLYVSKPYQGKKVGARLMSECLTFAGEKGYNVIWLGVWEFNPKAIAFYEKWGFQKFGSHGFTVGNDHQTDILMSRPVILL